MTITKPTLKHTTTHESSQAPHIDQMKQPEENTEGHSALGFRLSCEFEITNQRVVLS